MTQRNLPTELPIDDTPNTYSGTAIRAFLIDVNATEIITYVVVTNTAAVAAGATTATLSAARNVTLSAGAVLTFGTTRLTLTEDAALTAAGAAFDIQAAPANVAAGATTTYTNLLEIPLAEEQAPSLSDEEEVIRVHGRATPIRVVNGKDLTASLRTVAGLDNPVVKRLWLKGAALSPNNRERILWRYPDGLALLATVNIGAPTPQGQTGNSQRHQFGGNLSGRAYWADLNETTPTWQEIGA